MGSPDSNSYRSYFKDDYNDPAQSRVIDGEAKRQDRPVEFDQNGDPVDPEAHSPAAILVARRRLQEQEAKLLRATVQWLCWAIVFIAIAVLGTLALFGAMERAAKADQENFKAAPRTIQHQ